MTLFEFHGATQACLYLTRSPFVANREAWTRPSDYRKTQALAAEARSENVEMIRYESVRNPGGRCLAIMTPEVFKAVREPFRHQRQTWNLFIEPPGHTVWQGSLDGDSFEFLFA